MTDKQVNEFEVAAKVKAELQGASKEQVVNILRWVAESLGVTAPASTAAQQGRVTVCDGV